MKYLKLVFLLLTFSVFAAENPDKQAVLIKSGIKSSAVNCLTSNCHASLRATPFVHSPLKAKGCIVCHELSTTPSTNKKFPEKHPNVVVKMDVNELPVCQKCHVEWERKFSAKLYKHGAIEKRGCTSCHNPHGGDNKRFLREKAINQEMCVSCHKKNDTWEKGDDKDTVHRAINVKNKCLNCHEIHGGSHKKNLKDEPVKLCLACHEDVTTTTDQTLLHTPVRNGECLKCHSPHYSSKENMLSKNFENEDGYVKNVESSFELCLSCHTPMKESKFRNGEKNLHETHIKAKFNDKERGCVVCHEVHKSTQHMLIRTKFTYKGFTVPIKFTQVPNGGTCMTACHSTKGYDRVTPVVNKEGR